MRSSFFDSNDYDREYDSADFAEYFGTLVGNGVFANPAKGMQVYFKSGMQVGIMAGACYINGYAGYADGTDEITLEYGNTGVYRYDAIVARLDLSENARNITIAKIVGNDASSLTNAVKPSPVRSGAKYDIVLAYVAVGAGISSISAADIIDTRQDTSLCGIVSGLVNNIDTSGLFAQYEAQWELLKAACAQDSASVIKAWSELGVLKTINNNKPTNGNIDLTQSLIPSDGVAYQMPYYVQSGIMTVGKSALDGIDITFPRAFTAAPLIIFGASVNPSYAKYPTAASYNNLTNEGFTLVALRVGSSGASTIPDAAPCIVNWVALGQLEV